MNYTVNNNLEFMSAVKTNNLTLAIKLLKENSDLSLTYGDATMSILNLAISNISDSNDSLIFKFIENFISHKNYNQEDLYANSFLSDMLINLNEDLIIDILKLDIIDYLDVTSNNYSSIFSNRYNKLLNHIVDNDFDAVSFYNGIAIAFLDTDHIREVMNIGLRSISFLKIVLKESNNGYNTLGNLKDLIIKNYRELGLLVSQNSSKSNTAKDYKLLVKFKEYGDLIKKESILNIELGGISYE